MTLHADSALPKDPAALMAVIAVLRGALRFACGSAPWPPSPPLIPTFRSNRNFFKPPVRQVAGGRQAGRDPRHPGRHAELNGWDQQAYPRVLLDRIAARPINRIGELAP
jgi:hypothetical protein